MSRWLSFGVTLVLLLFISAGVMGMSTPAVRAGHGAVSVAYQFGNGGNDIGYVYGVEYGLTSDWGIMVRAGQQENYQIEVKYELNPGLALTAGGYSPNFFYVGGEGAWFFLDSFLGLMGIDMAVVQSGQTFQANLWYGVGLEWRMNRRFYINAGVIGTGTVDLPFGGNTAFQASFPACNYELAIGYRW